MDRERERPENVATVRCAECGRDAEPGELWPRQIDVRHVLPGAAAFRLADRKATDHERAAAERLLGRASKATAPS